MTEVVQGQIIDDHGAINFYSFMHLINACISGLDVKGKKRAQISAPLLVDSSTDL